MMITIDELIEVLEEARDDLGGDTEVLIATQRHYPLTHEIFAITSGDDAYAQATEVGDERPSDRKDQPSRTERALWLATEQPGRSGDLNPYAPEGAWDGVLWGGEGE